MRVKHVISLSFTTLLVTACGHDIADPITAIERPLAKAETPETASGFAAEYGDEYAIAISGPGSAVINVIEIGSLQKDVEYLKDLLIRAEAARIEARARARRDHAIADVIASQLRDAERQIGSIRHRIAQHDRIKVRIATRGRTLENVWRGDARPVVLNAMQYFFNLAGVSQSQLLATEVSPLDSSNFTPRGAASAPNYGGGNALHFLEFLRQQRLDVVVGSTAHVSLAALYDLISETAAAKIARHEAAQQQIRAERESVWGPLERFVASINDEFYWNGVN